ncbi:MAG: L,D-transpeptidase family protein [Actinomycetota bacterium]|nr:L,D-transpeptidase family protein [Actinomycetota bacterium]
MDEERENRESQSTPPGRDEGSTKPLTPITGEDRPASDFTFGTSTRPSTAAAEERPAQPRLPVRKPRRRFVPRLRTVILVLLLAIPLAAVAGLAKATYDYSEEYDGKILPGATIAGVDVGGMKRHRALKAVQKALEPQLDRKVKVVWKDHAWKVTPRKLGARSDARAAVERALAESGEVSTWEKAQMRFLGEEFEFTEDVALRYPKKGAAAFIEGLAQEFNRQATDASIDYSSGWVEFVKETTGREIQTESSSRALLDALESGERVARLDVKTYQPETTVEDFDQVILLRQSDYRVYVYTDGEITHEWPVAIGQSSYPTPTGMYTVIDKVIGPSWTNPDPEGWGADMPDYIPPGPSNPLGVAAVYWDAPGIRFHGTSDTGSIGTSASHGCVRFTNDDIMELYDIAEIGSPIVSTY